SMDVFKRKMDELMKFYPNWSFDKSDVKNIKIWYGKFKYLSDKNVSNMIDRYSSNEIYNPTVAGLMKYKSNSEERELTVKEKLEEVNRLIGLTRDYFKMNGNPERYDELLEVKKELEQQL